MSSAEAVASGVLENLPAILAATRHERGLSLRAAATQIGVTDVTVARIEDGERSRTDTAVKVLHWINNPEGAPSVDDI